MGKTSFVKRFIFSRSGRGFLLHLSACAALAAIVGYGFYQSSLSWFKEHQSQENIVALRLVDAFVTQYSAIRSQFGPKAPVPATFRAHSLDIFNKQLKSNTGFRLEWVGRAGRQIATPPNDAKLAETIESFAAKANPEPESEFLTVDDRLVFRTVYPSLAREQSCVDCHNQLQANKPEWRLNALMGAFAIDVPVAPSFGSARINASVAGGTLFLALGAFGLAISLIHFRQIRDREIAAAELSRTQN